MKLLILLIILILVIVFFTSVFKKTPIPDESGVHRTKIGQVINYVEHPQISIEDFVIKYIDTREASHVDGMVSMGDISHFSISNREGKRYDIEWTAGTGELPGPTMIKTNKGCYALHINIIDGKRLFEGEGSIQDRLVVYRVSKGKCDNDWAINL